MARSRNKGAHMTIFTGTRDSGPGGHSATLSGSDRDEVLEGDVFEGGPRYPSPLVPAFDPEDVGEADLGTVRFGRSRFLRKLGATLFGASVTWAVLSSKALAACPTDPPVMCCCSKRCCCCNASGCCVGGCDRRYGCSAGPGSCNCGWYTCHNGYRYFCSDWWQGASPMTNACTCQILIGCSGCTCP